MSLCEMHDAISTLMCFMLTISGSGIESTQTLHERNLVNNGSTMLPFSLMHYTLLGASACGWSLLRIRTWVSMLYEIHFMRSFEEAKPRHNLEAQECQLTLQFRLPISQLPITLLNHIVGTIATLPLLFCPKVAWSCRGSDACSPTHWSNLWVWFIFGFDARQVLLTGGQELISPNCIINTSLPWVDLSDAARWPVGFRRMSIIELVSDRWGVLSMDTRNVVDVSMALKEILSNATVQPSTILNIPFKLRWMQGTC